MAASVPPAMRRLALVCRREWMFRYSGRPFFLRMSLKRQVKVVGVMGRAEKLYMGRVQAGDARMHLKCSPEPKTRPSCLTVLFFFRISLYISCALSKNEYGRQDS